jgi:hypothetical protein
MKYGKFLKPNKSLKAGGGFTSRIIPFQLGKGGVAIGLGALAVAGIVTEGHANANRKNAGPITYQAGPARMSGVHNTGALDAIQKATDDPEVQADMIKGMMHNSTDGILESAEQYGINDQFLSAFYGMNQ